jgi:hypothetical protein
MGTNANSKMKLRVPVYWPGDGCPTVAVPVAIYVSLPPGETSDSLSATEPQNPKDWPTPHSKLDESAATG